MTGVFRRRTYRLTTSEVDNPVEKQDRPGTYKTLRVFSFETMRSILLMWFCGLGHFCVAQEASDSTIAAEPLRIDADSLIRVASSYIGVPYRYGGCSPETGFDCSGFVTFIFKQFGLELPRSSADMVTVGRQIPLDSIAKGDIVLFAGSNRHSRPIGHSGIVVSDADEPLRFIHSATSNHQGIIVTEYERYEYYRSRFVTAIRVFEAPLQAD